MLIVIWSDKVEGLVYNIDNLLCVLLYKEEGDSLVPWSGTYPDAKMNLLPCYKEYNYWIVPYNHYSEDLNNWQGPIHNCQF